MGQGEREKNSISETARCMVAERYLAEVDADSGKGVRGIVVEGLKGNERLGRVRQMAVCNLFE